MRVPSALVGTGGPTGPVNPAVGESKPSRHNPTRKGVRIVSTSSSSSKRIQFESRDCVRCSGKGTMHAFMHIANGVCFSCGGLGYRLTANGKRARIAYLKATDYPVTDLVVGARIRESVFVPTHSGGGFKRVTGTVESVEQDGDSHVVFKTEHQQTRLPLTETVTPALTTVEIQGILRSMAGNYKGMIVMEDAVED